MMMMLILYICKKFPGYIHVRHTDDLKVFIKMQKEDVHDSIQSRYCKGYRKHNTYVNTHTRTHCQSRYHLYKASFGRE